MRRRTFLGFELNPGWRWMAFQGAVAFAVIGTDIHWNWAVSPTVAGLAAIVAAFLATVAVSGTLLRWRIFRARRSGAGYDSSRQEPGFLGIDRRPGDTLQNPPRIRIGDDVR